MCITSEDVQNRRECVIEMRHIFSTSDDMQYKQGTSLRFGKGALFKDSFEWVFIFTNNTLTEND